MRCLTLWAIQAQQICLKDQQLSQRLSNFDDLPLSPTGDENPAHDGRLKSLLESDSDAPPQSTTDESEQSGDEGLSSIFGIASKLCFHYNNFSKQLLRHFVSGSRKMY